MKLVVNWRQILLGVLFVPACLWCSTSSGCAQTKTSKVTAEGPEKKYEVQLKVGLKK